MTRHTYSSTAPAYLSGTMEALLQSDLVTARTRRVLDERMHLEAEQSPRFFDDSAYAKLRAI